MRIAIPGVTALATALALPLPSLAGGWPAEGHDARNTGQSDVTGPRDTDDVASYSVTEGLSINVPAAVADDGTVYFGT